MERWLRLGLELPRPTGLRPDAGTAGVAPGGVAGEVARSQWTALTCAAQAAERAGFGALWTTDGAEADGARGGGGVRAEPCTLAAGLVPVATSVRLGVASSVHGRAPSVLARDLTGLDVVSGGRAAVLLHVGPRDGEGGFDVACRQLQEAIEVCRRLFTSEVTTYVGAHFAVVEAANRPQPLRPGGPPILVELPPGPGRGPAAHHPGDRKRGCEHAGALRSAVFAEAVGELAAAGDAVVVGGAVSDVDAARRLVGGAPLIWRGPVTTDDGLGARAERLRRAGADGLLVRLPLSGGSDRVTELVGAAGCALGG